MYGNLTHKSDAGNMTYDPTNNRLQSLDKTNGTQKRYSHDANGNMLQAGDNGVKWTSFNQPLEIRNASTNSTATFLYDTNQQRVQQTNGTTGKSETTTYVSKAFEVTHNDNGVNDRVTQYKHQIYAGDEVVAIQIRTLKNDVKTPDETRYLHKDALGNVDTITDSHGTVIQRLSYDPFGKRTVTSGTDPDRKALTARGFTGHEHLDNLGLIHMNARLYDPEIGRFISADSYIPKPDMSQAYNRYAYVMNNPLKYTDPSGHFPWLLALIFVTVAIVTDIPILDMIAVIAFTAALPGTFGLVGAMLRGAAAGFVSGLVSGTNPFKAALWGGLSAGLAWGVGHGVGGGLWKNGHGLFSEDSIGQYLAHGVTQGAISQLRGGNFKSGFVGAIAGGIGGSAAGRMMGGIQGISPVAVMVRTTISAVFGGLAARATGGSFEDGALSAAFTHLFNDEANNLLNPMFHPHHAEFGTDTPTMELAVNATGIAGGIGGIRGLFSWGRSLFSQCFIAGTAIHTKDGIKPIESIKVGDLVMSRDEATGTTAWKPVVQLFHNQDKAVLRVTLYNVQGKTETLGVTAEHPFHVEGKGWVLASKLRVGDLISGLREGMNQTVHSIAKDTQPKNTYNFEVEDFHTYFVGVDGVWVHNACTVMKMVSELNPLHSKAVVGNRPDLRSLSDSELLNSVTNPRNGDMLRINSAGKVVQGNSRTYELQSRALDPNSSIMPDTKVPVELYKSNNSDFFYDM